MSKLSRREFLKITGTAVGTLIAGKKLVSAFGKKTGQEMKNYNEQWIPSCCNMCGGQCGIFVRVINGKVVKIEPNPYNPNNFSNNSDDFFKNHLKEGGLICPKGNAGIATLYDPDRVKTPLRRTNPEKGIGIDPKWKEISWEEAYNEIVLRLKKLRDSGQAHKLLWFSEDHSFTHIQQDFCKLYGTPNYSMHSNLCDTGRKAVFKIMMGDERPLCDFINSKYILLFGWNPLAAIKWAHLARIIPRAIEKGAKLVVVDPYLSATSAKAHEWIPIRPGTDGAMALAMGNVIIREGLIDKEFIDEWTVGFEKYKDYVKDKTPKWAEKITSVPAKTIERIAIEFATTKPAIVDVWSGSTQHSNGVYTGWAIGLLAALTGQIDKPGTLVIPNTKGNKHIEVHPDQIAEKTLKEKRFDYGIEKYPYFHKSGVYTEIFKNIVEGKGPYQPKIAIIIFQNVLMSVPGGPETVAKALSKLEFVIVNDIFLSETAQFADIVIPGTTYLERYDLNTHWVTWPAIGLRQPVVKPIFGQPTEYEFICEIGRRLGLKEKDGNEFFWIGRISGRKIEDKTKWYEEYLSKELLEGEPKITLDELKKLPGAVWVSNKGTEYEKYKKVLKPEQLKDTIIEGNIIYSSKDGKKDKQIGFLKNGIPMRGFFTPSGKVQFYAKEHIGKKDANGKPLSPLPIYKPRDWQPTDKYPLYLINWKEVSHTHTRTQNNIYLIELKSENPLMINNETAKKLGIRDGDTVWVESPYGRIKAKAKLTEGIHPEVVGLQHGFGHWAFGKIAKNKGTSDSILRPTISCSISGQALHKECCVRIYK
ncbi:MAG: molybdopterin-dependent oxidoreductase [Candidatus Omnitrophica bacterium]|nr:molybdopterin-dependent oxidoreductase [Candidatus Omnitrophota bacterium]